MSIQSFDEAIRYLNSFIDLKKGKSYKLNVDSIKRMDLLLQIMGSPQNKVKIVHIAGTSGKGSTAYYVSRLLHSCGFKVGLHVSPHLIDARERCQIDNEFISEEEYVFYVNKLVQYVSLMDVTKLGPPTYFELHLALAYLVFYEKKVNYAVTETGCGGWFDGTNAVTREDKISVITRIGLDHMNLLGNSLSKITLQKAKIIQNNNIVIACWNNISVRSIIESIVKEKKASLTYVQNGSHYSHIKTVNNGVVFSYAFNKKIHFENLFLSTLARYQVENASIALSTVLLIGRRDLFQISENSIRQVFKDYTFAGRMEIFEINGTQIVLDGAHNPQKMRAFLLSLKKAFPKLQRNYIVAFKEGKNAKQMIDMIGPTAHSIMMTNFFIDVMDMGHGSQNPLQLSLEINNILKNRIKTNPNPMKAFEAVLAQTKKNEIIIVTGSLYLISCLYNYIREYPRNR